VVVAVGMTVVVAAVAVDPLGAVAEDWRVKVA
jgi:hypothetical protein